MAGDQAGRPSNGGEDGACAAIPEERRGGLTGVWYEKATEPVCYRGCSPSCRGDVGGAA